MSDSIGYWRGKSYPIDEWKIQVKLTYPTITEEQLQQIKQQNETSVSMVCLFTPYTSELASRLSKADKDFLDGK